MKTSKYILILMILCVVAFVFLGMSIFKTPQAVKVAPESSPINLCFSKVGTPNVRGYADEYTLRMLLDKENVTGELKLLPAEKDSKVGKFSGTVGAVDKMMMARTVDVWWDSSAEGMQVKEQLRIIFGEGTAQIGFGEMVDRGDGTYVYKDPTKIDYSLSLTDVACDTF